ncbi:thiol reductant ABC exporter subunit CydC [Breoghania sp.]|uniref:thiol reductant ABC exporter subunit CydC n=1 Tax=Breoghania sp. TaxID=2065378 RepID=UPI0029CA350C|nr:thiol reductant ABC exporter subunit CydC [Breoghania sp.]
MSDFARLLKLMRPQAGWMLLSIALSAIATLAHVALMATSGWFITAMAAAGIAGVSMNYFTPAGMIRAFAMVRTAGRYAERLMGHEATLKFVAKLRPWLFSRLEPLAPAALEDARSGDLLTRLRGDIDRLEFAFLRIIQPIVVAGIVLAAGIAFAARYEVAVAIIFALLALGAGVLVPLFIGAVSTPAARRVSANTAEFNALLVDHLEGRAELDIYDPDHRHRGAVLATSEALIDDEQKIARLTGLASASVGLATHIGLIVVIGFGGASVAAGTLAGPDLVMLALLGLALFEAVGPLPLAMQSLPLVLASARRIFALADRPAPVEAPDAMTWAEGSEMGGGVVSVRVPDQGDLVFDRVSYTYPGATRPALSGISLTLSPGKRLAVVGPSGSGKSSLVSLALRYRAASHGSIRFGGLPAEACDLDTWRAKIAVLAQSDHLFSASIADNLRLAGRNISREQMVEACKIAGILPFIEAQPQGFDTFVGALGAKVSGGEARRLGLARALLKDAPVLILDEPTEGLDRQGEAEILQSVLEMTRDRAVLLIAHSRTCLEQMDEIVVLEDGGIAARGAPDAILPLLPATVDRLKA